MKKNLAHKLFKILLAVFIVIIPFQVRWIFYDKILDQQIWEYGRLSLYGSMIVLLVAALFFAWINKKELYLSKDKFIYFLFLYSLLICFISPLPVVSFYYLAIIYLAVLFAYLVKFLPKKFVFRAILLSGSIQSVFALVQMFSQKVVENKWLGMAGHLPETLGTSVVEVGLERVLRAYGTLSHPNILGGFLFVAIFAGLYLWLDFYQKMEEHKWLNAFKKKNITEIVLVILGLILCSYGFLASFSRSALLALALSLFSVVAINILKRKWTLVNVSVKYIVIFLLLVFSFNVFWPGTWSSRLEAQGRLEEKSISDRVSTYDQLAWDNPKNILFGQGLGMNTYNLYLQDQTRPVYDNQPIHDIFLLLLAEVGVIGALLLINVVRLIIKSANKVDIMSTSLLLGLIVIGLFDHYLWTSWTGWLLASFGLVNMYKHKD